MIFLFAYASFGLIGLGALGGLFLTTDRAARLTAAALWMTTAALLSLTLATPGIVYTAELYFGDLWVPYDGFAKASVGIQSSLDYFNPIGPAVDWAGRLATVMVGVSSRTLFVANAIVGVVAVALGVAMLRRRVGPEVLAAACFVSMALAVSGREIDVTVAQTTISHLAPYNRWGWALLAPVALRILLPADRRDDVGGIALGVAIALMLLVKATYGLAALALLWIAAVLRPGGSREALVATAAALTLLGLFALLSPTPAAYVADIAVAGRIIAERGGPQIWKPLMLMGEAAAYAFAAILGLLAMDMTAKPRAMTSWLRERFATVALLAAGIAAGMGVMAQNHHFAEASPYAMALLAAIAWARRGVVDGDSPARRVIRTAMLLAAVRLATLDVGTVAYQAVQARRLPPIPQFAGTAMAQMRAPIVSVAAPCAIQTCSEIDRAAAGVALLQAAGATPEDGAVLSLNFSNPFPALLGVPSPRHAPVWLHKYHSFTATEHVPADRLFEGVAFVMVARGEGNADALVAIYRDHLDVHFEEIDANQHWRLLRGRVAAD